MLNKCAKCGVVSTSRPQIGEGHHVLPGDQENDWICYGEMFEVAESERLTAPAVDELIELGRVEADERCASLRAQAKE